MTTVEAVRGITGGVDTHRDTHVAAALAPLGGFVARAMPSRMKRTFWSSRSRNSHLEMRQCRNDS
jgi:hypothetical protein